MAVPITGTSSSAFVFQRKKCSSLKCDECCRLSRFWWFISVFKSRIFCKSWPMLSSSVLKLHLECLYCPQGYQSLLLLLIFLKRIIFIWIFLFCWFSMNGVLFKVISSSWCWRQGKFSLGSDIAFQRVMQLLKTFSPRTGSVPQTSAHL